MNYSKVPDRDVDNFVDLYRSGKSLNEIAALTGYGSGAVRLRLMARGVERRPAVPLGRPPENISEIVRRYESGESVLSISKATGYCRSHITKYLKLVGVPLRTFSEVQLAKSRRMTPDERMAMTSAAHAALRGRPASEERLRRAAIARQKSLQYVGDGEMLFARWMRELGYSTEFQVADGRYNIDIAVGRVAVEIHVCPRHPHTWTHHRKRIEYLLDRGWDVVYVWISHSYFLTEGAREHVAAFVEECKRDESMRRRYRVIRGTGELVTEGRADRDYVPGVV